MTISSSKVGKYIQKLRIRKGLTQNQLGKRLNISYQAVSKWERGETLPDTLLLLDLATILETSVDNILNGGEKLVDFEKKIYVKDIKKGIDYLSQVRDLIGKDNTVYEGLVNGINNMMNIDVEKCFNESYYKEALIAEITVQNLENGAYVDITDVKDNFSHEHWIKTVCDYAKKHKIK